MSKKLHIWDSEALTRSVLDGVPIEAACGFTKVVSREDVDKAATSDLRTCKGCASAIAEMTRTTDVHLNQRSGWAVHLERQVRRERAVKWSFTITTGSPTNWGYTSDWPLAG